MDFAGICIYALLTIAAACTDMYTKKNIPPFVWYLWGSVSTALLITFVFSGL